MPNKTPQRICAFCHRNEHQVMFLIPSPDGVYICDECVKTCAELIDESLAMQESEGAAATEEALTKENTLRQDYYSLLDGSVRFAGPHYAIELWGRNLANTEYAVFHFESISHPFLQKGRPRTFGVTLSINL